MALVPDLQKFVKELLDKLDQEGKLTWHDNGIPEDEIWVKIGENVVEVVLKFVVRLQTQKDPIPVITHIILIAMVFVKDSYDVLSKILGKLQKGIHSLKREIGGTKSFVFFIWRLRFFFCKSFGLSGPNVTYPCLWCLATSKEMQQGAVAALPRTLDMIKRDHKRFLKYGKVKIASA